MTLSTYSKRLIVWILSSAKFIIKDYVGIFISKVRGLVLLLYVCNNDDSIQFVIRSVWCFFFFFVENKLRKEYFKRRGTIDYIVSVYNT